MPDVSTKALIADSRPGRIGRMLGKMIGFGYRLVGKDRYDDYRLERVQGMPVLVLPTVANPRLLRSGAFFASQLDSRFIDPGARVLDLGTGSGICALFAARHTGRVVATDVNPAAINCARINCLMNGLEKNVDLRIGDLFAPVADQRFDLVLFNPPFLSGAPQNHRDAAWRAEGLAARFATDLFGHLEPGGRALLVLSSFGDACARFESELRLQGYALSVVARRRYVNEVLTMVCATPPLSSASR